MSETNNQNHEAPNAETMQQPVCDLPIYGPVPEPARRHHSMPAIALEKDIFHMTAPATNEDAKATDAEPASQASPEREFFSNTIVPPKDEIARKAHALYRDDCSRPNRDAENWAKAEAQIDPQRNK